MSNDKYELLAQQLQALIEGEPDLIANLSNASAAINEALENIRTISGKACLHTHSIWKRCMRNSSKKG